MKTADLVDLFPDQVRLCHLPFIKLGRKPFFSGPVATVKCHEDNALLKKTLQAPGRGRVMVVDAGGSTRIAVLGDMIAEIMRENGWAGIIINGAVRDRIEIEAMDVGIYCLGTSPIKSSKLGYGQAGIPVEFGNVRFDASSYVYADSDGILVSPRALI